MSPQTLERDFGSYAIAVIGLACRFPGAPDARSFWRNLRDGVEAVTFFTDDELAAVGVAAAERRRPNYVPAKAYVEGANLFDAEFFGMTPREAEITDPQHRLMLECAWHALEEAGYGDRKPGPVGVVVSGSTNAYVRRLLADRRLVDSIGLLRILLGNDKDHLATWISYKLDLTGPSMTVQTACSSSLVAVHSACQMLLTYQCDMAIAGGVTLAVPEKSGYAYEPGGILSPDGHCRSFDAAAQGSTPGEGAGVVVLRRLADAVAARDNIRAVIRGSAINNDGASKVGFTAPSVSGQAEVIELAHANADIDCDSISYVEAHGSATRLGDPVEAAALAKAFAQAKRGRIGLGSVKSNIGHAGAAAGIAGLMKTVLALENKQIPASLHFESPNPEIDLSATPFEIVTALQPWHADGPRIAGVSSFGLGGTNVHAVLQEGPAPQARTQSDCWRVLPLSARTPAALEAYKKLLRTSLEEDDADLGDLAFTLQTGRKRFDHRLAVVCRTRKDAIAGLASGGDCCFEAQISARQRPVVFLFPGVGDHYPGMAGELYRAEPAFRRAFDQCAAAFEPGVEEQVRQVVSNPPAAQKTGERFDFRAMVRRSQSAASPQALEETVAAHCAVFAVEYALAQLWLSYGVTPAGMLGYSLGECVCAAVSGVLPIESMAKVVVARARFATELAPRGAMLASPCPADVIGGMLPPEVYISGVAGPDLTLLSGSVAGIEETYSKLQSQAIAARRLPSAHAFHCQLMRGAAGALTSYLREFDLRPGSIRWVSNLTGRWITPEESTSPEYWGRHLCEQVRLSDGLRWLRENLNPVSLELGPGQMLSSLMERVDSAHPPAAVPTLPAIYDQRTERQAMAEAVARLWLAGADVAWERLGSNAEARRVPLPLYPFERRHYEIPEPQAAVADSDTRVQTIRWRQLTELPEDAEPATWILAGVAGQIRESLMAEAGVRRVVSAAPAPEYGWAGQDEVRLDFDRQDHIDRLMAEAADDNGSTHIVVDTTLQDWPALLERLGRALAEQRRGGHVIISPLTRKMLDVPADGSALPGGLAPLYEYAGAVMRMPAVRLLPVDVSGQPWHGPTIVRALLHAQAERGVLGLAVRRRTIWALDYAGVPDTLGAQTKSAWAVVADAQSDAAALVDALKRAGVYEVSVVDPEEVVKGTASGAAGLPHTVANCDVVVVYVSRAQFDSLLQPLSRRAPGKHLLLVLRNVHSEAFRLVLHQELKFGAEAEDVDCSCLIAEPGLPPGDAAEILMLLSRHRAGGVYLANSAARKSSAVLRSTAQQVHELGEAAGESPLSETERIVAEVWQRVLGIGVIRADDNFFRMGGNSLLGLQVTSELRRLFEIDLSPHSLFESPTLGRLAATVEDLLIQEIGAAGPADIGYEPQRTVEHSL